MADDKDADNSFYAASFFDCETTRKADHVGPPLVNRQVSNLLVVHFIGRLSLETKPCPKSWPTLSIIWRRLKRRVDAWTEHETKHSLVCGTAEATVNTTSAVADAAAGRIWSTDWSLYSAELYTVPIFTKELACEHTRRPDKSSMFPAHFRDDSLLLWASSACEKSTCQSNSSKQQFLALVNWSQVTPCQAGFSSRIVAKSVMGPSRQPNNGVNYKKKCPNRTINSNKKRYTVKGPYQQRTLIQ